MLVWHDKSSIFDGLSSIHSPPSSIFNSIWFFLHPPSSNLLDPPHFSIFNSSSSILRQKNGIFDSKSPQNNVTSDKVSASAACNFFQVCHMGDMGEGELKCHHVIHPLLKSPRHKVVIR